MQTIGSLFRKLIEDLENPKVSDFERWRHLYQVTLIKRNFKSHLQQDTPSFLVIKEQVTRILPNLAQKRKNRAIKTLSSIRWSIPPSEKERREAYHNLFGNSQTNFDSSQKVPVEKVQVKNVQGYENFELKIGEARDTDKFIVYLLNSPVGRSENFFSLPPDKDPFWRCLDDLKIAFGHNPSFGLSGKTLNGLSNHEYIGKTLFDMLINHKILACYQQCSGKLGSAVGLRILIRFEPNHPELAFLTSFPWELLYDSERREFLGHDPLRPVVRCLDGSGYTSTEMNGRDLSILAVKSSPKGFPSLNFDTECETLSALAQQGIRVTILDAPDLNTVRQTLRQGNYSIFHFMGHGGINPVRQTAGICLVGAGNRPQFVSGKQLALCAKGHAPALFVINACQDSMASQPFPGGNYSTNIATRIVTASGSSVISMQSRLTDEGSVLFSKNLYRELARPGACLEAALAETRLSMHLECPRSQEWAIPMLFQSEPLVFSSSHSKTTKN